MIRGSLADIPYLGEPPECMFGSGSDSAAPTTPGRAVCAAVLPNLVSGPTQGDPIEAALGQ
jgi:hypothetical protein